MCSVHCRSRIVCAAPSIGGRWPVPYDIAAALQLGVTSAWHSLSAEPGRRAISGGVYAAAQRAVWSRHDATVTGSILRRYEQGSAALDCS